MVQSTGLSTRISALALVGLGFVGLTFLGLRGKDEPVMPPDDDPPIVECAPGFHFDPVLEVCVSDDTPPPDGCDPGFHEENGVCVPNDPEVFPVIDSFTQSTQNVQSPGIVGFTVKPRKARSTIRWFFGDGTDEVLNAVVVNHEYFPIGGFNGFVEVVEEDGRTERIDFFVNVTAPDIPPPGEDDIISNFNQNDGVVFNGEAVGFSIALGVQVAQVKWNFGDGTPEVFNQITVDHIYNQVGTFDGFVEAIATVGGVERVPFTVRVEESPLNQITLSILIGAAAGSTIEPGENVDFAAQVGGGVQPFIQFNWNFGDGTVDTGDNRFPNHIFEQAGSFTVTLEVKDSIGNTATATKLVSVKSKPPQFGDVTVTIGKDIGAFDFLFEYRNNRQDIPISGSSIIRVFDGNKQIHSRVNGFQIPPLGRSTNGLDIRDQWPRETPLIVFVEFNDVNGKLLDDASLSFVIPDDTLPLMCDPGFHEENGICVADQIDPIVCNPGFHEENGICVRDEEPDDELKLETKDFKVENFNVAVPQFSSQNVLTILFRLPGDTVDIQFARVFVSARMDYESFASMKIVFNGQALDTIQYGPFEGGATRDRDIVVTNLVRKDGLDNTLELVFETSNLFSPGAAFVNLASVFVQSLRPV